VGGIRGAGIAGAEADARAEAERLQTSVRRERGRIRAARERLRADSEQLKALREKWAAFGVRLVEENDAGEQVQAGDAEPQATLPAE
jgi:hypothetical protein